MSVSSSFPLTAGRPFTLWQDPARWPVPPLKLPGRAFTLWQDPARWPQSICRLPGLGHTLWLDPATWPAPRLRLPGAGFTLWNDPEQWPQTVKVALPAFLPPHVMPIPISRNHAFTLWTRPSQVTPIPMKNGLTAAQVATTCISSQVAAPVTSAGPKEAMVAATVPAAVPFAHRLLPLAAGIVAVLGLNALVGVAESRKTAGGVSESAGMDQRLKQADKELSELQTRTTQAASGAQEKAAQIDAKALVLKEENARLVTNLTQTQEAVRKAEGIIAKHDSLVGDLRKQVEEAKLAASVADTKAQSLVVTANEEASAVKRESASEIVKLRETLARVEADKAAALKAAATAAQEKATVQQALDAARKTAP